MIENFTEEFIICIETICSIRQNEFIVQKKRKNFQTYINFIHHIISA